MNIQAHIENLKTKPEHVRKQIALWSSAVVTLVIFLFWLAATTGLSSSATSSASAAVANAVDNAGAPAQSMLASVSSLFGDIKDILFTPKKITYSSIEASPGK